MAVNSEPLIALLEVMLRTLSVPKIKPGGHPEEIFLDLTEEEKEKFECAICYQIMKEVRQCSNKHKFCYSCIFVWSTSGNPINHDRCPVCRTNGDYVRNHDLDEQINLQRVKCSMKSCTWTGLLKYLPSHQHTTYSKFRPVPESPRQSTAEPESIPDLPPVTNTARSRSSSRLDSTGAARASTSSQTTTHLNSVGTSTQNEPRQTTATNTLTRSRARSRQRNSSNSRASNSQQRRSTVTATGLNSRLTSRARIQNDGTISSNDSANSENNVQFSPRPPPGPRPNNRSPRRMPTLPSIVNNSNNPVPNIDSSEQAVAQESIDINNNSGANMSTAERPLRHTVDTARAQRLVSRPSGFGMIRERLNESRQRLDMLMGAFSVELDRGRRDLSVFQEERERRRQEQLQEVRELGRRLGHVAQELRGLLNQRSQIRQQINQLADSNEDL